MTATDAGRSRIRTAVLFCVNGVLMGSFATRLPDLKHGLDATDGPFGLALLGATVGAVAFAKPAGAAIARYGEGPVARLAMLVTPASMFLLSFAGGLVAFGGLLVAFGVAAVALNTAVNSMAAAVERLLARSVMSGMHALYSGGGLLGAVTGGLAAGAGATVAEHFAVLAVLCLVTGVVLGGGPPRTAGAGDEPAADRSGAGGPRVTLLLGAMAFCFYIAEAAIDDWSAIYLHDALAAPAAMVGAGYAAFCVAMAVGRLFGDRIVDRIGAVWAVRAGSLLAGVALTLGVTARSLPAALAGFTLFGLGMCVVAPACYSAAGRHGGRMIGTVTAAGHVGLLAGPAIIGGTSHLFGIQTAMLVPVVLAVLVAALAAAVKPAPRVAADTGPPALPSTVTTSGGPPPATA
ncbi:MFS transporter [Micromonospora fiedleri]|uniref:MFS transporter n=1 Tax=Micromonospora fiedleri TaxID=1157498 RepID=A0ABS1UJM5_9ACTN|nr:MULTISPECIES: MFS transporter [Micromonospora]MBL6275140.1 MFS transporter [Micromonospora fiedleri]WSK44187.1 MFS transporter [Micromonospora maris]